MIKVYASLILKGLKTIDEVPFQIRDKVQEYLNNLN